MKELKSLIEKRNALIDAVEALSNKAIEETRAFTAEEQTEIDEKRAEIDALANTIDTLMAERAAKINDPEEPKSETRSAEDIVEDYIRGKELRANEIKTGENGAIIPQKLSEDIIRKVKERSGLYDMVAKVTYPGVYKQIQETDNMTAAWTDELATVLASKPGFKTVDIGHEKLGALAKVSLEMVNQAHVPILPEINNQITEAFADALEKAMIYGTGSKQPQGLGLSTTNTVKLAAKTAITADELIKVQGKLRSVFGKTAKWVMNSSTLTAVRLLKDNQGRYLFTEDLTKEYSGYILGKPVLLSDEMAELGGSTADKTVILYGDFNKAYKVNNHPSMFIQVLREKYIDEGALGVIGFLFADGKIVNEQAYVNVKTPA